MAGLVGGVARLLRGVARILSGSTHLFGDLPEGFLLLADLFEFLPVSVPEIPCFLSQHPEPFRLTAGRLGAAAILFGGLPAQLGVLTAVLGLRSSAFSMRAFLL